MGEGGANRQSRVKVLFICGAFRSGSSLLDAMLGEVAGYYSGGELRSLWENGFMRGHLCGCGQPVSRCEFWRLVHRRAFAPLPPPAVESLVALQKEHIRLRPRQVAAAARARSSAEKPSAVYGQIMAQLYNALREDTRAAVIVDSSKGPLDLFILASRPEIELYAVHLVRDPRGVAHSWGRVKAIPRESGGTGAGSAQMPRRGSVGASAHWLVYNGGPDLLVRRRLGTRYMRVRYEDYMRDPRASLEAVCAFVGEARTEFPFLQGDTVKLRRHHRMVGNPGLLATGKVKIQPDQEWVGGLSRRSRLAIGVTTAPLARRYGYRVLRG